MSERTREQEQAIVAAAEAFVREAARHPSRVLDGLADRLRHGAKRRAREAYSETLTQIATLREQIWLNTPVRLVASGEAEEGTDG